MQQKLPTFDPARHARSRAEPDANCHRAPWRSVLHHTEGRHVPNWALWRGLISLCTVGLALVLYRAVDIPFVAAIITAFVVTTAFATVVYLLWVHDHNDRPNQ